MTDDAIKPVRGTVLSVESCPSCGWRITVWQLEGGQVRIADFSTSGMVPHKCHSFLMTSTLLSPIL